jgi:retron-type reverse transcriptase
MAKRHADLFDSIVNFSSLRIAAKKAVRSKRKKPGAAAFMANFERELLRLERELKAGEYRPGRYVEILIREPKERLVSAAPFRDRVVHHALCSVVQPIFERGFIANSFANRKGKGTHAAIRVYERYRDRSAHLLRCDIFRYFPSIDHMILKAEFRRRISCARTLALMDAIVDGANPQEAVELYFAGDDLFEPFMRRRGLPIGNLTSQFSANLYLDRFDHWVTETLGAPYLRYVDDFALFHDDPEVLAKWREQIGVYLQKRRLMLHPRKTFIAPTSEPLAFLGFQLAPGDRSLRRGRCGRGRRRLPEDNVARFKARLRAMRAKWRTGSISAREVASRVASWIAHARHAETWRLRRSLFAGGWFAPQ